MQRRHWLTALLAALTPARVNASSAIGGTLVSEDLTLPSDGKFSCRARLLVDPHKPPRRLLILLHGRGEADSVKLALEAWPRLYGLLETYARLQSPPVQALLKQPRWEDERAARINTELTQHPFEGFAVVCPVTPNPAAYGNRSALYHAYATWLTESLVPAVKTRVPSIQERIGLDGCSMGGALAFEVFLQRPQAFKSFGTVQAALGDERADTLAQRFAALRETAKLPEVHLLTSSGDPYLGANQRLSRRLREAQVDNDLEIIHGPHNQPWLRQMGTLAMLFWHDRAL